MTYVMDIMWLMSDVTLEKTTLSLKNITLTFYLCYVLDLTHQKEASRPR